MNAQLLEELNQSYKRERGDYFNCAFLTGATLKRLFEETGSDEPTDDQGLPLVDEFLYCSTPIGIFEVE